MVAHPTHNTSRGIATINLILVLLLLVLLAA
jgi:hypothetical protein